jgi:hypothetical protein
MNLEIKVVAANPADAEVVGELVYSLLLELFAEHSHLFPLEKMQKAAAELLPPDSGVWSFLAMNGNDVVGMINLNECSAIYAGGKFGEITELYVKPEFRSSSLSDLGNRSEAGGKPSPFFRSFEAHSGNYATKKIGKMGRFPTAAVDYP